MNNKSILAAILVLVLVTLACSFNIDLSSDRQNTGPTETKEILVPALDDPDAIANVELNFGAGELSLEPNTGDALIEGTATYNMDIFEPEIETAGNNVKVYHLDWELKNLPRIGDEAINRWELKLGDSPMNLTIKAGAFKGEYELGGLALHNLNVDDGAAQVNLSFSEPNPVTMDTLRYNTGASDVKLSGLANANFSEMIFRSGAGANELDFSGEMQQDADVEIVSGISDVTIIVPEGTNAVVRFEGGLTDIDPRHDWDGSGNTFTLSGSGPKLTITVKMGAGKLELRNR